MAQEQTPPSGPDLTKGVGLGDFVDDKLLGHVGDEEVLLVRSGGDIFAVGAHCSHYHGPLAEGLVTGASGRSARSIAGEWSSATVASSSRKSATSRSRAPWRRRQIRPKRSSSSAAARPALRRPNCCPGMVWAAAW